MPAHYLRKIDFGRWWCVRCNNIVTRWHNHKGD
jgi:hypothetical protein